MLGILHPPKKKQLLQHKAPMKRRSPTVDLLIKIVEEMDAKGREYTYEEIAEKLYGKIDDSYKMFFCISRIQRFFRNIRRRYLINAYQINGAVKILKTEAQFDYIIKSHEKRVEDYENVIKQLKADMWSKTYKRDMKTRIKQFKQDAGGDN